MGHKSVKGKTSPFRHGDCTHKIGTNSLKNEFRAVLLLKKLTKAQRINVMWWLLSGRCELGSKAWVGLSSAGGIYEYGEGA